MIVLGVHHKIMAVLNENTDLFKCLIRVSHFTKNPEDDNKFHKAYTFGIQSVAGKILTFHIMTDYGMMRSRVPISETQITLGGLC